MIHPNDDGDYDDYYDEEEYPRENYYSQHYSNYDWVPRPVKHAMRITNVTDSTAEIICECGKIETVVEAYKNMDSMSARHFMINDIWPWTKESEKWPLTKTEGN